MKIFLENIEVLGNLPVKTEILHAKAKIFQGLCLTVYGIMQSIVLGHSCQVVKVVTF
jgi:hypothetical protein